MFFLEMCGFKTIILSGINNDPCVKAMNNCNGWGKEGVYKGVFIVMAGA